MRSRVVVDLMESYIYFGQGSFGFSDGSVLKLFITHSGGLYRMVARAYGCGGPA